METKYNKIKSKALNLAYQLILLRKNHYKDTFGKLTVKLNKDSIDLFEKNNSANEMDDITEIVNGCVRLSFYMEYSNGKFKYHIF